MTEISGGGGGGKSDDDIFFSINVAGGEGNCSTGGGGGRLSKISVDFLELLSFDKNDGFGGGTVGIDLLGMAGLVDEADTTGGEGVEAGWAL